MLAQVLRKKIDHHRVIAPSSSSLLSSSHHQEEDDSNNKNKKLSIRPSLTQLCRLSVISLLCFLMGLNVDEWGNYDFVASARITKSISSTSISTADLVGDEFDLSSGSATNLHPGELPGYTGWPRPASTSAGYFHINTTQWLDRNHWNVILQADEEAQKHQFNCSQTWFYARAYGPAVSVARTYLALMDDDPQENNNPCTYNFTFPLYEAGLYYVEIVVTASNAPPIEEWPLQEAAKREFYEGFMVADFPRLVRLRDHDDVLLSSRTSADEETNSKKNDTSDEDSSSSSSQRTCGSKDVEVARLGQEPGRWVVKRRNAASQQVDHNDPASRKQTLKGFQDGVNNLGVLMEYDLFADCKIPKSLGAAPSSNQQQQQQRYHVVYVGDSTMRMQKEYFDEHADELLPSPMLKNHVNWTYITTHGGLNKTLPDVKQAILDVVGKETKNTKFVFLYNSGLHDVCALCVRLTPQQITTKENDQFGTLTKDPNYRCLPHYQSLMRELTEFLLHDTGVAPSQRQVIFQTSTAAWVRWGNYGFEWPPSVGQRMAMMSDMSAEFNRGIFDIIRGYDIPILDGYWITLARPDDRQVSSTQKVEQHMAHAGVQVIDAQQRVFRVVLNEIMSTGMSKATSNPIETEH